MNIIKLRSGFIYGLCAAALLALAPLDAHARRLVIDDGEFLDLSLGPGCTIGIACAGSTLPFQFDFGGGLTDQAFIYDSGIISFGAQIPLSVDLATTSFADFGVPVIAPLFDPSLPSPIYQVGVGVLDPSFLSFTPTLPSLGFSNPLVVEFLDVGVSPGFVTPATWLILDGSSSEIRFEFVHGMSFDPGFDSDGNPLPIEVAVPSSTGRSLGYSIGEQVLKLDSPDLSGDYAFAITSAIPEPATWATMIAGFGMMGAMLRRRRAGAGLRASVASALPT